MSVRTRPANMVTLRDILPVATRGGYALGAFAARYTVLVRPILQAAQALTSPVIVQVSQKELGRVGMAPAEVADQFYRTLQDERIQVPAVLHLDHTRELGLIQEAIGAGFSSVMIDASEKPLDQNIATSREVADYAHAHAVSVEAELGRIGTTDFVETDADEELYTDPVEAERFVRETEIDALAVSVGTAHGVYTVRHPKVDLERLQAIRERVSIPLVLHGGSGVPAEMMRGAIQLPGGGVSKVNIATDVELAFLEALGRTERISNAEASALPQAALDLACEAVRQTVADKIKNFVLSEGKG